MRHFAKQTKIIYVFGKVRTLCSQTNMSAYSSRYTKFIKLLNII